MPQRRLSGWTPGSPIDGQRLRVYRELTLAGTYDLPNDATEKVIDVVENANYKVTLHSYRETEESHFFLEAEFTTVESGSMQAPPMLLMGDSSEVVPGPSGVIYVDYA